MKISEVVDRSVLTFFGSGLFPVAPGTAGSLAALVVGWGAWNICDPSFQPYLFPLLGILASAGCVICGERIEALFGKKDPGAVVIDEAAGQWLALSALPWLAPGSVDQIWPWAAAFVGFRILDVLKPFGIRRLESLPRGWGVLLDDVAAGLVVAPLLWIGMRYWGAS